MEIDVVYKYRAPGETMEDEITLEHKIMDLTGEELNDPTQPHGVGERVPLASPPRSSPEEVDQTQVYKVIERNLILRRWGGSDKAFEIQELQFVVTDTDT